MSNVQAQPAVDATPLPPVRAGDRATTVTSMRPTGRVRHAATGREVDCRSDRGWIDAGREVVFARREERWLIVRPQPSGILAATATLALTGGWGVAIGWLGRQVQRGPMPSLRAALVFLFAVVGFAAAGVICLPTLGAPQTAIVCVASSAIGACTVTVLEVVVGHLH